MIDPRTVILLGEELDQLRAEMTKQARLLGISAEKELALRAENERLKKRCFPSKVLMIGDAGHYVSEAVFVEMERLKSELAEAKKDAERYRWLRDSSVGPSQIWELLSDDCNPPIMTLKSMHELDAAIDEAMKGK